MPELPEVETVRRSLSEILLKRKIQSVIINYSKIIDNQTENEFMEKVKGQTFHKIDRKGKYLIFYLDDYILLSHLRMEGKYFYIQDMCLSEEERTKHDHVIFIFEGAELRYHDTRKFGRMYLYPIVEDIYHIPPLSSLGFEPFDESCTVSYLKEKVKQRRSPIKTILLDQSIIAGLGNIYADEVLFMCHLHPLELTSTLSDEDFQNIIFSSILVLNKAISLGGTTIRSFESSYHITGRFQNELKVHEQKVCPVCKNTIQKIVVGGRGTYYCPTCQKLKS